MVRDRKRKAKAPADFQRQKTKVGKRSVAPNATNTTVQVRTVHVPDQLGQAHSDEPSNVRGLSLSELLKRVGHYSPGTRKEALLGLVNLFARHPSLLQQAATLMNLLDKVAPRFGDSMPAVRAAARVLLHAILPHLSLRQLAPFFPLCLARTCSAMTSLEADVRSDSLELLDIWHEFAAPLVAKHAAALVPNLLMMITTSVAVDPAAARTKSNASAAIPLRTRLAVLRRLLAVLELGVPAVEVASGHSAAVSIAPVRDWNSAPLLAVKAPRPSLQALPLAAILASVIEAASEAADAGDAAMVAQMEQGRLGLADASLLTDPARFHVLIFADVFPLVVDMWLEYGPTSLSFESSTVAAMNVLLELVLVALRLFYAIDPDNKINWLSPARDILHRHFLVHFPLRGDGDIARLNLGLIQCANALHVDSSSVSSSELVAERVVLFASSYISRLARPVEITAGSALDVLLELLQAASLNAVDTTQFRIVELFVDLNADSHFRSPLRQRMTLILARYILSDALPASSPAFALLVSWVTTLPRLLWELKDGASPCCTTALTVLHALGCRGVRVQPGVPLLLGTLQTDLAALFFAASKHGRQVAGPFFRWTVEQQHVLVSALYFLETMHDDLVTVLARATHIASLAMSTVHNISTTILLQAQRQSNPTVVLPLALSMLVGHSRADLIVIGDTTSLMIHGIMPVAGVPALLSCHVVEVSGVNQRVATAALPSTNVVALLDFWKRRLVIINLAISCLQRCQLLPHFCTITETLLNDLLDYRALPFDVCFGLVLALGAALSAGDELPPLLAVKCHGLLSAVSDAAFRLLDQGEPHLRAVAIDSVRGCAALLASRAPAVLLEPFFAALGTTHGASVVGGIMLTLLRHGPALSAHWRATDALTCFFAVCEAADSGQSLMELTALLRSEVALLPPICADHALPLHVGGHNRMIQ